jgi:hypothetical protein
LQYLIIRALDRLEDVPALKVLGDRQQLRRRRSGSAGASALLALFAKFLDLGPMLRF